MGSREFAGEGDGAGQGKNKPLTRIPEHFSSMYIKFCRSYGEDKKDEAKENLSSKLSVELEGEKGRPQLHFSKPSWWSVLLSLKCLANIWLMSSSSAKQTEGNARLYRAGCILLTIMCLVLLLVVIVLSLKREYLQP